MADIEAAHRLLGLTDDELAAIVAVLGREPNDVELALYSVMWSEHCSYKSSRVHLGRLPSEGPRVLVGPGENAGVVDVGDGLAIAIRIESHNHPSAVEPYQGAATGAGGILRDVFTMGARPIALMDPLFVGPLDEARNAFLLDGIVRGVAGYGNSVGVPTVGGSLVIDPCYSGNPLVNVFCLGLLRVEHLVLARASGAGNLAVLLGARTGRDGIGGVSVLASAGFADDGATSAAKRPSVQVGDPFEEKRLIEACLELLQRGLVTGIQDLGGAGLACATSETAANGGAGMDVDLSAVPLRDVGMTAAEIMTSESQERMLAIVTPAALAELEEVCRRWEVRSAVIGTVRDADARAPGRLRILERPGGEVLADVPARSLADDAPRYRRPLAPPADLAGRQREHPEASLAPDDCGADLLALLQDTAPIYRQYDHQLFLNTVCGPGEADAAVLRLAAPGIPWAGKGLALSCDANPGWCAIDPRSGTAATVAESALNVACTGAEPIALVNCLNFGNPEHLEVMWELSESIDGMAEACRALSIPIVGGNVSLYNESGGVDIDPTPVVTVVGLIEDLSTRPPGIGLVEASTLVLLGTTEATLGGSRWARQVRALRTGALARLDLGFHARLVHFVARLVAERRLVEAVHDVGDGGLAVALAEMVLASGIGCRVSDPGGHAALFSESPSRVVICTGRPDELLDAAGAAGVPAAVIGRATGTALVIESALELGLDELRGAADGALDASFAPRSR